MPEAEITEIQIKVSYEGESLPWGRIIENAINDAAEESQFTDSPCSVVDVEIESD